MAGIRSVRGKIIFMAQIPSTVPQLLNSLRTMNPTAPRLTWYGPDSERVELSGRVLDNWVAKTANFLADELDAEPGTVVVLDMPVHWRSLVWLLAIWSVGATAHPADGTGSEESAASYGRADIVATTDPAAAAERLAELRSAGTGHNAVLVAVALPALAMRWMGQLPEGAVDYSGEVRAHADVFFPNSEPASDNTAWETPQGTHTFAQLVAPAAGSSVAGAERVLLKAPNGWDGVVREALQIWANGGSIVLLDPSVEATDRLRATEKVTRG